MKPPRKIQELGLPIFYKIKTKNNKILNARFDPIKKFWFTQTSNKKISNKEVVSWE